MRHFSFWNGVSRHLELRHHRQNGARNLRALAENVHECGKPSGSIFARYLEFLVPYSESRLLGRENLWHTEDGILNCTKGIGQCT